MAEDPRTKTILVVDDDKEICEFFQALLSRDGFNVLAVQSGDMALKLFRTPKGKLVHLVILDMMMPAPGGYEVMKELQGEEYHNVPIVIATSRPLDQGTVEMLRLESNVHGFFQKPINPQQFRSEIHALLGTV